MTKRINFLVKVQDAKLTEVKKALEKANIKVTSIIAVYTEEDKAPEAPAAPAEPTKEET
ncbi:MAG: hypothetical protein HZA23_02395 [Nitrospirae bacterium]|nr:hypothetical protein [Nitrospirota bacterium]